MGKEYWLELKPATKTSKAVRILEGSTLSELKYSIGKRLEQEPDDLALLRPVVVVRTFKTVQSSYRLRVRKFSDWR